MTMCALLSTLFFASCDSEQSQTTPQTRSIELHVDNTRFAKNISRDLLPTDSKALLVDHYEITGTGPTGSEPLNKTISDTTTTLSNMLLGYWTLTVSAKNASGKILAQGTKKIQITYDLKDISINLDALPGTGSFSIQIKWDASQISSVTDIMKFHLMKPDGTILDQYIPDAVGKASDGYVTFSKDNLPSGSYLFEADFEEFRAPHTIIAGTIIPIRIIDGTLSTSDPVTLSCGDLSSQYNFSIVNQTGMPIKGSISNTKESDGSQTLTYTASDCDYTDLSYTWFCEGEKIADAKDSSTITITPNKGTHNYFVSVYSPNHPGSGSSCAISIKA